MKFFRNNWYWVLGIVIGLGIGSVITMHRVPQQTSEPEHISPDVAEQTPDVSRTPPLGETAESGFWHGDHWHKTPDTPSPGTRNKAISIPTHSRRKGSIMDRISHGAVGIQPIMYSGAQMQQKRKWREMMDAGEITPEEYAEKILELTVGDMDTASAVRFYEKHGNYNTALLARLDTVNAFRHLKVLQEQRPHRISKLARRYAERVLSETVSDSPEHFEAKLFLADTDTDFPRAATLYRELLKSDPDSQYIIHSVLKEAIPVRRHIYVHLGNRLWRDHPEEAIPYLKMAVQLDEPHGDYPMMSNHLLGYAYERIGDYKTAWVYHKRAYKKTGHWSPRDHFEAIEAGKPLHEPLRYAARDRQQGSSTPVEAWDAFVKNTPKTFQMDSNWEKDSPGQDTSPGAKSPIDSERAHAAKQAREEFLKRRERAQKEFDDFLQWMESIENAAFPIDTNNFLIKEMEAHLKGGTATFDPERIIRAFETLEHYGSAEGMKHLQKNDPEVTKQIQHLLDEKRPSK